MSSVFKETHRTARRGDATSRGFPVSSASVYLVCQRSAYQAETEHTLCQQRESAQKGTELVGRARNASASDQTNRTPDHVERRSHPIDAFENGGPAFPLVQLGRLSFHLDRLHEDLELTVDVVAGNLAVQSTKDRLALFMMSS